MKRDTRRDAFIFTVFLPGNSSEFFKEGTRNFRRPNTEGVSGMESNNILDGLL